jgi:hypothetical protein
MAPLGVKDPSGDNETKSLWLDLDHFGGERELEEHRGGKGEGGGGRERKRERENSREERSGQT